MLEDRYKQDINIFLEFFLFFQIVKHGGNGQQSPSSDEDIKNNTKTTNLNNTPAGDTKTESLEAVPLKV